MEPVVGQRRLQRLLENKWELGVVFDRDDDRLESVLLHLFVELYPARRECRHVAGNEVEWASCQFAHLIWTLLLLE